MAKYIPPIMLFGYVLLFVEIKFNISYVLTHMRRPSVGSKADKKEFMILLQVNIAGINYFGP